MKMPCRLLKLRRTSACRGLLASLWLVAGLARADDARHLLPVLRPVPDTDIHASGVLLNAHGDVLTAHHAVRDCGAVKVVKYREVVPAQVVAMDEQLDLAVLQTRLQPYLSATLTQSSDAFRKGQPVFTESYMTLRHMAQRSSMVSNAIIAQDDELSMLSGAKPGASGSPVLGSAGLMLGMVVERVVVENRPMGKVMLSRPAPRQQGTAATQVRAVGASDIKQFLVRHDIPFQESDRPQLAPLQAQAPRAATLSVGVMCE